MADTMIAYYNLAPSQTPEAFEQWLREVDIPGYSRLRSLSNPAYFRAEGLLGEEGTPPFAYMAIIDMTSPEAVEAELGDPAWAEFVADFESRTQDARFVVARKINP